MKTTLLQVFEALIAGFDGLKFSNGDELSADQKPDQAKDISEDRLPYLLFDVGNLSFEPWKEWEQYSSWDVPAVLKIKAEPGDADTALLAAAQDIVFRTRSIMGLPVDETGKIVPYGPDTAARFDRGELTFLAERGAPFVKQFQTAPSSGRYASANLIFHVETVIDLDPRVLGRAQVGIMGITPVAPGQLFGDDTLPSPGGIAVVADRDLYAFGGYDTVDPTAQRQGRQPTNRVAGVDPRSVARVNVTPYSASLSVGTPTSQLQAVAIYGNYSSSYVTAIGTWASTNAAVATVSTSGLVTRVAAGSCTVTCTFNGAVSNAVSITCS